MLSTASSVVLLSLLHYIETNHVHGSHCVAFCYHVTYLEDLPTPHYSDAIIKAKVSQITGFSTVWLTVCSAADQRSHQSFASLTVVMGNPSDRWIPLTKGQWCGKCFHLITSSCGQSFGCPRASEGTLNNMSKPTATTSQQTTTWIMGSTAHASRVHLATMCTLSKRIINWTQGELCNVS